MLLLEGDSVNVTSLEKINHTLVGGSKVFGDIACNRLRDQVPVSVSEVIAGLNRLHLLVLILFEGELNVLSAPNVGDLHLVESQGAGLVRANVGGAAHNFAGSELLDVVLVLKHLALRVGERDHNSKGETFGDSDDDNGDANNDVVNPQFQVLSEGTLSL